MHPYTVFKLLFPLAKVPHESKLAHALRVSKLNDSQVLLKRFKLIIKSHPQFSITSFFHSTTICINTYPDSLSCLKSVANLCAEQYKHV